MTEAHSQVSTLNNHVGNWEDASSWVSGIQPNPLTVNINDGITINGYITRNGDLSFANVGQANNFTINDTLVIKGDISFANRAANLVIPTGGLLIVFENFSATNRIEIQNGGLLVIMGDMSFSPSNQDDYVNNGGGLYVDGNVSGNADAGAIDKPIIDLIDDGYEDVYEFVSGGGSIPLPIELISFSVSPQNESVHLYWATASELNNDYFTIERSRNGKNFEAIARVEGSGTTHTRKDYSYTDQHPFLGLSYYRLRQTDYDGTNEVFPAVRVLHTGQDQLSIYPNPLTGQSFQLKSANNQSNESFVLKVYNIQGKCIFSREIVADVYGNIQSAVDLGFVPEKGTYLVELLSQYNKLMQKIQAGS